MDRDAFIITVYCLVCEHYAIIRAAYGVRHGGFAPALTDEEVITMEIGGEYCKCRTDKDLYGYFRAHYRHFFPRLMERTRFVRQAANLWAVKAALQRRLTVVSGQATAPVQILDTLPLPVCGYTRSARDRCFKPEADYGYCAARDLYYYGFKLGLRIRRDGMIIHCPLLPARPHDIQLLDELVEGFVGYVPADQGFIDAVRQALLAERRGIVILTPPRRGMRTGWSPRLLKASGRLRKYVETVGSQLTEHFAIARIRVHDLWPFQQRLIRKVLAHTVGVFLRAYTETTMFKINSLSVKAYF
jgi:hypothetical protein